MIQKPGGHQTRAQRGVKGISKTMHLDGWEPKKTAMTVAGKWIQ